MRVSDPFVNGKGASRISVNATAGELAQVAQVFGSKTFAATFDAEEFARTIAPQLKRAGGAAARQASDAGLTVDPPRERGRKVARAPKVAATPAPDLEILVAQAVASALAAAQGASASAPKPARKPASKRASADTAARKGAAARDAQIAKALKS